MFDTGSNPITRVLNNSSYGDYCITTTSSPFSHAEQIMNRIFDFAEVYVNTFTEKIYTVNEEDFLLLEKVIQESKGINDKLIELFEQFK